MTTEANPISTQRVDTLLPGQRIFVGGHKFAVQELLSVFGDGQPAVIALDEVTGQRRVVLFTHPGAAVRVLGGGASA